MWYLSFCDWLILLNILSSRFTHIFLYLIIIFKFWCTCAECAHLIHRYTCAMMLCCTHNPSSTLGISPNAILPSTPTPNRPRCVMLPSLCPRVLIVQLPLLRENIWCLFFCSCISLLRMMVSSFIHDPAKDMNSFILMAA